MNISQLNKCSRFSALALRLAILTSVVFFSVQTNAIPAAKSSAEPETQTVSTVDHGAPVTPTKMQEKTTRNIVKMLSSRHFRNLEFNDALSEAFLEKYLENLDPAKMYLLESDVESLEKYQKRFDDDFKAGKLDVGFEIYHLFKKRMTDRLTSVVELLENPETTFDFSGKDEVEIDREFAARPKSIKEADELWYKRIKLSVLNQILSDKTIEKARETILKRYKNQLHRLEQENEQDIYESLINSLTVLFDPHTNYFSPRTAENFNISMSLSLEGIGAVLQSEDEYTKVVRLVVGGPANRQGQLKPADKIVGVGQGKDGEIVDVVGWRLDEVVDLIRGKKSTTVRLEVLASDNSTKIIPIVRDEVKLEDQAAKKAVFEVKDGEETRKIGIIDIPTFYIDFAAASRNDPNYKSTTGDVARLVKELQEEGVEGIVLDLRNNGGGSLFEATQLTDLFIDKGPVVQIKQANGRVDLKNRAYSRALYTGPLVVMINRLSASASEIFAGAIQDYRRGLVVGSQSFGKGTVQLLTQMPEGRLKLTESKFYRVSGDSTQHRGVIPDISMPVLIDHDEVGESTYDSALPWDQIHPAAHIEYYDISSILPELRSRHEARAKDNPEFKFIHNRLQLSQASRDKKTISLNEEIRKKEKLDMETKALAYENARRKAKGLEEYKTLKAYQDAQELEEDERAAKSPSETQIDLENDALLSEAGHIIVDFSKLIKQRQQQKVATRTQQQES